MSKPVIRTSIAGAPEPTRGKVRDIYDLGDRLLLVATDRISAFDVILPTPIPDKGKVLNRISEFWFRRMGDLVRHHVVETDVARYPEPFRDHPEALADRSMLVLKTRRIDIECVARGYLAGSGFVEYQKTGRVCGIELPPGLVQAQKLPEPIFTPATKADEGHDENISYAAMADRVGEELASRVRDLTLAIYRRAADYAEERGLILADTKFEFGLDGDELIWIDEALTPDSSRFWPRETYAVGTSPVSFDKQFVRDYLLTLPWDKQAPGPELPDEVVARTRAKYLEAFRILTGNDLLP